MRASSLDDPRLLKAFRNLEEAVSLQRRRLFDEADKAFARVVKKNPDYFDALHFYGLFKYQQGQFTDALRLVAKATKINPGSANALSSLGVILAHLGRYGEALASFDSALALDPNHLQALSNRSNALNELGRYEDAIESSDRILKANSKHSEAYISRGAALFRLHRYSEALECYERCLQFNPAYATAWVGRGNVLFDLRRYTEAGSAYEKALALKPDFEQGWIGRGHVCQQYKRYDEAFAAYEKAFALKPDVGTEALRLNAKMFLCDWSNFNTERANVILSVKNKKGHLDPFFFLAISGSAEDQLQCARSWITAKYPAAPMPLSDGARYSYEKIRVGYVSADFRPHATPALLTGVLECHDRTRFETTGISLGPDDQTDIRKRIEASFDDFIDVESLGDREIASLIRSKEIDILIDLMGFTQNSLTSVFAYRPAPIQVNYLGYPGTMGASYIDYIIADPILIPERAQPFYTEKIVYLPNSYQANDDKRLISGRAFSRAEFGLPYNGFVFCCFNNSYKIFPDVFDRWMGILKKVEDSVLWLLEDNAIAAKNLRQEAAVRGVNPERLIFAGRLPPAEHLARHRLADLSLDTLPVNAHTTGSDALWAGLPILTLIGDTFAGRVGASLLNAVGLPELVVSTPQEYEELAVDLAANPEKLAAMKQKLSGNRLTKPLFNTQMYTRHIEQAYLAMFERYQTGLAPADISINACL